MSGYNYLLVPWEYVGGIIRSDQIVVRNWSCKEGEEKGGEEEGRSAGHGQSEDLQLSAVGLDLWTILFVLRNTAHI